MSPRFRFAFLLVLAGLGWWTMHRARLAFGGESPDGMAAFGYFFAFIVLCLIFGIILVVWVLPSLGELVGNFFFAPDEQLDRSWQDKAREALERGDSDRALDFFRKAVEAEPGDLFSISEVARLLCAHRHTPGLAREFLEEALGREWTGDDLAFLLLRLADVCAHHAGDPARARELWQGVIESYPGTNYAGQAQEAIAALDRPGGAAEEAGAGADG